MKILSLVFSFFIGGIAVQLTEAQSTWGGAGTDQNWSTSGNWSSGGAPANDAVIFPDGVFPITTNTQGAVNNIVQSSTAITSLTYNNNGAANDLVTTLIPSGSTLTVNGGLVVGNGSVAVSAAIAGGGSLAAGTGTTALTVQSTSGTAKLDLSGLTNFSFNAGGSGGAISLGTGSSSASGTLNLAGGSNNVTTTTLSIGNNNTGGTEVLNLGNGTNIINADTITMGFSKTVGTMQFLNNAGGGLKIADHTGTGRTTLNVSGEGSSGATGAANNGFMLFNGGTVNILGSTLTLGNRTSRTGNSAIGVLSFNSGVVDITTVLMALNTSGSNANGTISVGGGMLIIGTGGMSLVNSGNAAGCTGTLIITNGGTVICSNNIYKSTANGTGTITMSGGNLNMASIAGTIGVSNGVPIDNFNITNSTLTLPIATPPSVATVNFNPDATTQNTINVSSLPSIATYPAQFPIISYTTPGGNLNSLVLGTLPSVFSGYISNNTANFSIDLVVTNGPAAKADEWGGGVNNLWDTTTLNWTNNGVAVTYLDLDFVTFDDLAQTGTVNLTGARQPATLEINNSVLNYTFTGIGRISGPVALNKDGSASLTLAETGGDNFSLGIAANAGTIILDNTNSTISGGLVIAGGATVQIGSNDGNGALPSGTLDDEGTLVFSRTNNITVGTAIPGGGALTQNGSGKLTLSAANSYTGGTTVGNGTLALTGSGSISSSGTILVSNATLDVSGVTAASTTLTSLTLTNASLNVKVGYLQTNLNMSTLTMNGTANTINVASLPPIAYYPATVTLLQTSGGITGYNFVLGTLPSGSTGSIALSGDQTAVLLTLTSGPTNTRPSVTWSGVDALGNGNTNWSDALNWQTPGVPAATESVSFNDTAVIGGSPFDVPGDGNGGIVNPANINNFVDISLTNAALSYANDSSGFHNTQIASGKTLTVNGNLTVSGSGGTVTILGTSAAMKINNSGNINVENGNAPTLDMSGLDTFTAIVGQIGVGFNTASVGSNVRGTWYLARTNIITTGVGNFGTGSALVVGGSTGTAGGTGQLYLGQTNALYVDGIVLGASTSTGDFIEFNPTFTNNPVAYIRGISGDSSRVTAWSLGDDTVNLNTTAPGSGFINDFSVGTLNALVKTLIVGQGPQGNAVNNSVKGTFNMGSGNLDVTTLNIGVGGISSGGTGGAGIGIMNISNGTVVVNSLGLGLVGGGAITNTTGTLNLTNATLVVSNGITIGTGTAGGTLNASSSTVKILNGTVGTPAAPLSILGLDGGTLQLNANATASAADIVTTNITTGATTTINIGSIVNVSGTVNVPLISYTGTDPFSALSLGTYPVLPGYTVSLFDDVANSSVDLSLVSSAKPTPHITGVSVSGATLTISATNGALGGQFVLLGTTNVAKPFSQWIPILTNNFDGSGNLNLSTNIINPLVPQQFYLLSQ